MDYLCAKFGDFSFNRFGFIVWTESHTEANDRYTYVTMCDPVTLIFHH